MTINIQYFYLQGVVPVIVSSFHGALHPLGGVKVLYIIILYADCPLQCCVLHRHYAHCCLSWITSNIVMILLMKVSGQYKMAIYIHAHIIDLLQLKTNITYFEYDQKQ